MAQNKTIIYTIDGINVTQEQFNQQLENAGMLAKTREQAEMLNKHFPWRTTPDKTARFMKSPTHIFMMTEKID